MREILFRGKRLDNGKWVEGYFAQHKDRCAILRFRVPELNAETADEWIKGYGFFKVDSETVCQYTGLTNAYDKKVFEGDICEFSVFDWNGHDTQYKGVVVYDGSRFMLWRSKESEYYGDDGGFDLDWVMAQDDEFQVIGNIFDNTDLLTTSSTDSD